MAGNMYDQKKDFERENIARQTEFRDWAKPITFKLPGNLLSDFLLLHFKNLEIIFFKCSFLQH